MGAESSTNKSKENERAHEMVEELKLAGEKLREVTDRVSQAIQRIEEEQEIVGTTSDILVGIDKDITSDLVPGLCYKCKPIARKHITEYKTKRMKKKSKEKHATPRDRYLSGLKEHQDVYRGPQNPPAAMHIDGKPEILRTENRKLESKVSMLSSQLNEANDLKHRSDQKCEELESSLKTLEKQSEKEKEKSNNLQKENEGTKKKIQKLELDMRVADTHFSEKIRDLEHQLSSVNLENKNLLNRIETLDDLNSKLKKEGSKKQQEFVKHLQSEKEDMNKNMQEKSNLFDEKVRDNADLVSQLHDSKKAHLELQNILDEMSKEQKETERKLEKSENMYQQAKKEIDELKDKKMKQGKSQKDLETKVRKMQEEEDKMFKEQKETERKLETSENMYQQAKKEIVVLSDKTLKQDMSLWELETKVRDMQEQEDKMLKEQKETERKLEKSENMYQQTKKEIDELSDKTLKQDKCLWELETKVRDMQEQEDKMSKEQKETERKLQKSENLYQQAKKEIVELSDKTLKQDMSLWELETKVRDMQEQEDKMFKEQKETERKLETSENMYQQAKKEIDEMSKEQKETERKLEKSENLYQQAKKEIEETLVENSKQEKSLREMEIKVRDMQEQEESMKKELEKLKKVKPSLVVGVRTLGSGLTPTISNMIILELSRLLRGSFKSDNVEVTIKQCTTPNEVPNGPLVVLCLTQTRIGSNVKEALDGIEASQNVIILVMHHKEQENTGSIYATKSRIGGNYPKVGDILDMVFLDQRGIYDCDFNAETLHNLRSILSKYVNRL